MARRKVTHITEVLGMEGDVVTLQDLILYEVTGEDAKGNLLGRQRSTGIARPRFWDRAVYYGQEHRLAEALARPRCSTATAIRSETAMLEGNEAALAAGLLRAPCSALVFTLLYPYFSADRKGELRLRGLSEGSGPNAGRLPAIWPPTVASRLPTR